MRPEQRSKTEAREEIFQIKEKKKRQMVCERGRFVGAQARINESKRKAVWINMVLI